MEDIKLAGSYRPGRMKRETETEFIERRMRDARILREIMNGKPLPRSSSLWKWLRRRLK